MDYVKQVDPPLSTFSNVPFKLLLHDANLEETPARIGQGNPSRNAALCAVA